MIRLHAVVEGQTEETFVNAVLAPELAPPGVVLDAHRVTTGRLKNRTFRGGFVKYGHIRKDVDLWMRQDDHPESWFTTMIDLYALLFAEPRKFDVAFPDATSKIDDLVSIREGFSSPEPIDDGFDTAPSRRILQTFPGYKKTVAGPEISAQIGMACLRRECAHFDAWIAGVERLASAAR